MQPPYPPPPPAVAAPGAPVPPPFAAGPPVRQRASGVGVFVHLGWEVVLLLGCVGLLIAVQHEASRSVWPTLVGPLAILGLQTVAVAVSLRTRTLNLAVTGIAGASSLFVVSLADRDNFSLTSAIALVLLLALVVGAVFGALTGLTRVPGWAMSLVLLAITGAITLRDGTRLRTLPKDERPDNPRTWLTVFVVLVVIISLIGGVLWLLAPVRRALGADVDPAAGIGARVLGGVVGFGGSTVLAALAGVASVLFVQSTLPPTGSTIPLVALALALLGGVSVFGGRGGVAGTVLAAVFGALFGLLAGLHGWATWVSNYLFAAIALAVGIGLSLIFALFERDRPAPAVAVPAPTWHPYGPPPGEQPTRRPTDAPPSGPPADPVDPPR